MLFRFLCFCLVIQIIQAKTEEEVRTWFLRQALECSKDYPVSPDEMSMLQKHKMPNSKNAKCLLACIFKKAKFLNNKGMFDVKSATAQAANDHAGDATRVENSKKLMEMCQKINSETVGDGEEGCDRAILLFKCFTENAPSLGFWIQGMR